MQISVAYQSALLTAARNSYGGTTRLLIVRDSTGTALSSHAIGLWSEIANGGFYATVADDENPANTGTPATWEINVDGVAVHKDVVGSGVYLNTTLITEGVAVSVIGGQLLVMRPIFDIADDEMGFVSEGVTFAPRIGVTGSADFEWVFADGTTETATIVNNEITCTKNYGSGGTRLNILRCSDWSIVNKINLGFNGNDGGYGTSPITGTMYSPYSDAHPSQYVSEILNLRLVKNSLQKLLISRTAEGSDLLKWIDLTGFTALEVAEFYLNTSLQWASVVGCTNLRRICFEGTGLVTQDFSTNSLLEDIRFAYTDVNNIQWRAEGYPNLWHLCLVDDHLNTSIPPLRLMPIMRELWVHNNNLSQELEITSANVDMRSCSLQGNDFTQTQVDNALVAINALNRNNINFNISGSNAAPSPAGVAAAQAAIARGCTITYTEPVTPTVETPVFNPNGATSTSEISNIQITCPTEGAVIYYTVDGSTPTTSSNLYSEPLTVSSTAAIRAIAVLDGYNNSSIAQATFTINTPQVATPVFSPVAGSYEGARSVSLSCETEGAVIYYRINSGSWVEYTEAIAVSSSQTIDSYATASGYLDSDIVTASYTITLPALAAPAFNPIAGTYVGTQSVTIAYDSNSTVREYSTDGTNWQSYTEAIEVSESFTLYARSSADGYQPSSANASYIINAMPTLATPTFSPAAGTYTGTQSVSITYDENATVREYSLNGTDWYSYSSAISIASSGTLYARSSASGYIDSSSSAIYTINTPTLSVPVFNPVAGTYSGSQSISIAYDANATVREYSTDNVNWQNYTSAITISETTTVYARCSASGYQSSSSSATYTISETTATTLEFTSVGTSVTMTLEGTPNASWELDVDGTPVTGTGNINYTFDTAETRRHIITLGNPTGLTRLRFGSATSSYRSFKITGGSQLTSLTRMDGYPCGVIDWQIDALPVMNNFEMGSNNDVHPYIDSMQSIVDALYTSGVTGGTLWFSPAPTGYDNANYTALFTPVGEGGRGWGRQSYGGVCVERPT